MSKLPIDPSAIIKGWAQEDLRRQLSKFSHDYGDQRLIKELEEWLSINLGGEYVIQKKDH